MTLLCVYLASQWLPWHEHFSVFVHPLEAREPVWSTKSRTLSKIEVRYYDDGGKRSLLCVNAKCNDFEVIAHTEALFIRSRRKHAPGASKWGIVCDTNAPRGAGRETARLTKATTKRETQDKPLKSYAAELDILRWQMADLQRCELTKRLKNIQCTQAYMALKETMLRAKIPGLKRIVQQTRFRFIK